MIRTLLYSLFDTLSADKEREKIAPTTSGDSHYKTFWNNYINVVFYIEELVLTFNMTNSTHLFDPFQTPAKKNADMTYNIEDFRSSILEISSDLNLYSFVKKGLFYSNKNEWQDARFLDVVFEILEPIWFNKAKRRSTKLRKSTVGGGKIGYIQIEDNILD